MSRLASSEDISNFLETQRKLFNYSELWEKLPYGNTLSHYYKKKIKSIKEISAGFFSKDFSGPKFEIEWDVSDNRLAICPECGNVSPLKLEICPVCGLKFDDWLN